MACNIFSLIFDSCGVCVAWAFQNVTTSSVIQRMISTSFPMCNSVQFHLPVSFWNKHSSLFCKSVLHSSHPEPFELKTKKGAFQLVLVLTILHSYFRSDYSEIAFHFISTPNNNQIWIRLYWNYIFYLHKCSGTQADNYLFTFNVDCLTTSARFKILAIFPWCHFWNSHQQDDLLKRSGKRNLLSDWRLSHSLNSWNLLHTRKCKHIPDIVSTEKCRSWNYLRFIHLVECCIYAGTRHSDECWRNYGESMRTQVPILFIACSVFYNSLSF